MSTKKKRNQNKSNSNSKSPINKSKTLKSKLNKDAIIFDEYDETLNNTFISSLNKNEKNVINYYQGGSSLLNGFLRDGYNYLSKMNKKTIIYELKKNSLKSAIKELTKKINLLDKVFTKTDCPKTTQDTILYRGTDKFYPGINKGYTSCSKTMEALFDMKFVKGDVEILSNDCCVNILILDPNIPYLDLENNNDRWKYQEEVLLPRGLIIETIEESTTKYNEQIFKVYINRVMINNNEKVYTIPEIPKDNSIDIKKIKFIIDEQGNEIIKLSKMFVDTMEWTDEKEDIDDLILYIYDLDKKSIFTEEDYNTICKRILNTLKNTIPAMMESNIVRDECKPNLKPALDKVEEILSNKEPVITPEQFIEVNEC
jgi:hypothetical protein